MTKNFYRVVNRSVLAMFLVLGMSASVIGDSISVEVTTVASGSLGSTNFTDATVTIFGLGDTDDVFVDGFANLLRDGFTATFEIEGVGSGEFTDAIQAVSNNNSELGGFGNVTQGTGLVFIQNSVFETYDLQSSLDPVSGPALFVFGIPHATTMGNLRILSGSFGTFSARVGSIPEPGSLVALTVVGGLIVLRRRRAF